MLKLARRRIALRGASPRQKPKQLTRRAETKEVDKTAHLTENVSPFLRLDHHKGQHHERKHRWKGARMASPFILPKAFESLIRPRAPLRPRLHGANDLLLAMPSVQDEPTKVDAVAATETRFFPHAGRWSIPRSQASLALGLQVCVKSPLLRCPS